MLIPIIERISLNNLSKNYLLWFTFFYIIFLSILLLEPEEDVVLNLLLNIVLISFQILPPVMDLICHEVLTVSRFLMYCTAYMFSVAMMLE